MQVEDNNFSFRYMSLERYIDLNSVEKKKTESLSMDQTYSVQQALLIGYSMTNGLFIPGRFDRYESLPSPVFILIFMI